MPDASQERLDRARAAHKVDPKNNPSPDVFPNIENPIVIVVYKSATGHVSMYYKNLGLDAYPKGILDPLKGSSAELGVAFGDQDEFASFSEKEKKFLTDLKKNNTPLTGEDIEQWKQYIKDKKSGKQVECPKKFEALREIYSSEGEKDEGNLDLKMSDFCQRVVARENQKPTSLVEWLKKNLCDRDEKSVFVIDPKKLVEYYQKEKNMTPEEAKAYIFGITPEDLPPEMRGMKNVIPNMGEESMFEKNIKRQQNEKWNLFTDNCASKVLRALGLIPKHVNINGIPDSLEGDHWDVGTATPSNLEKYLMDLADHKNRYVIQITPQALEKRCEKDTMKNFLRVQQQFSQNMNNALSKVIKFIGGRGV